MSYKLRLAIDLDNTIISYEVLFMAAAREGELVSRDFAGAKQAVREAVRRRRNGELEWQALQAHVYGDLIGRAAPFPGVREFVLRARALDAHVSIVSHKTMFAAARPGGKNLLDAARDWLYVNDFIGTELIASTDIYFEPTRKRKIGRIRALEADIVIDDLVEVFDDPGFPCSARRWLFVPGGVPERRGDVECFGSWQAMREALDA
jgi:hypothetical protein